MVRIHTNMPFVPYTNMRFVPSKDGLFDRCARKRFVRYYGQWARRVFIDLAPRAIRIKAGFTMRLFIADADQELRVGLQLRLHQEPGMLVVGIADQANGLLAQIAASQPDVLLLDWLLPGRPARDVVADLHALERRPEIIVLSVRPEVESAAMAAGADAFVTKAAPPDRLVTILRSMRSKPEAGAPAASGGALAGGGEYE